MSIISRFLVPILFLLLCNSHLTAGIDLTSSVALGVPRGDLRDYSYGSISRGVSVRASTNVSKFVEFFAQGHCIDFGLDSGNIPRDNVYSDAQLQAHTDSYIFSLCPGISVGKNLGGLVPYLSLSGGINYVSSMSRIHSPDIRDLTLQMTNSGTNWCAGASLGIRAMLWEPVKRVNARLLDAIFIDFRLDYYTGGDMEYLDWRRAYYKSGELHYGNTSAKTEMFIMNIGIDLRF